MNPAGWVPNNVTSLLMSGSFVPTILCAFWTTRVRSLRLSAVHVVYSTVTHWQRMLSIVQELSFFFSLYWDFFTSFEMLRVYNRSFVMWSPTGIWRCGPSQPLFMWRGIFFPVFHNNLFCLCSVEDQLNAWGPSDQVLNLLSIVSHHFLMWDPQLQCRQQAGPRTQLWGIPVFRVSMEDVQLPTLKFCGLFERRSRDRVWWLSPGYWVCLSDQGRNPKTTFPCRC